MLRTISEFGTHTQTYTHAHAYTLRTFYLSSYIARPGRTWAQGLLVSRFGRGLTRFMQTSLGWVSAAHCGLSRPLQIAQLTADPPKRVGMVINWWMNMLLSSCVCWLQTRMHQELHLLPIAMGTAVVSLLVSCASEISYIDWQKMCHCGSKHLNLMSPAVTLIVASQPLSWWWWHTSTHIRIPHAHLQTWHIALTTDQSEE